MCHLRVRGEEDSVIAPKFHENKHEKGNKSKMRNDKVLDLEGVIWRKKAAARKKLRASTYLIFAETTKTPEREREREIQQGV